MVLFQISFMPHSPNADIRLRFFIWQFQVGKKIIPSLHVSAAHFLKNCFCLFLFQRKAPSDWRKDQTALFGIVGCGSLPFRFEYLLTHKNECRRYLIRRLFLPLPVWFCEKNFFVYPSCTSKSGISLVSIFVGNRGTTLFLYRLYEYYTTKGAKINSLLPERCSSIWFCTAFPVSRRKQPCQSIN